MGRRAGVGVETVVHAVQLASPVARLVVHCAVAPSAKCDIQKIKVFVSTVSAADALLWCCTVWSQQGRSSRQLTANHSKLPHDDGSEIKT